MNIFNCLRFVVCIIIFNVCTSVSTSSKVNSAISDVKATQAIHIDRAKITVASLGETTMKPSIPSSTGNPNVLPAQSHSVQHSSAAAPTIQSAQTHSTTKLLSTKKVTVSTGASAPVLKKPVTGHLLSEFLHKPKAQAKDKISAKASKAPAKSVKNVAGRTSKK